MKRNSSRELIQMIQEDGWYLVRVKGDHHQFMHPTKIGLVTIAHPNKDLPVKTQISILKQAGLK